jgi:predicted Kef-type K+ transport protein
VPKRLTDLELAGKLNLCPFRTYRQAHIGVYPVHIGFVTENKLLNSPSKLGELFKKYCI